MDFWTALFKLTLVLFLVFLNGFFVAAEFAVVKIRSSRLETLLQEGNKRAKYAKMLTDHLDASLSVTQLGITLASLGLGWIGEPAVAYMIDPLLSMLGVSEDLGHSVSFVIAFSVITALHIVLGELTPKSLAIQKVEAVVLGIALPMLLFQKVMYPAVWVLNHVANWVLRRMGFVVANEEDAAHTEAEIRILMEESHKQGYIDKTELTFVDNVFEFSERHVREIMIPRTDMICLYLGNSVEENIQTILQERMTRYPMCVDDKDNIIGFLHIKDLLPALYAGSQPDLRPLIRQAPVVPETMPISNLLKLLQKHRSQLAIVVDEYGGTSGMVTIEDIIEEIVGEIQDEFDEERPMVEKRGENMYSVDAKLLLSELNDILELDFDEENVDTIGGWLYAQVEIPPQIGQKSSFNGDDFFIEEVESVRITRVLIKLQHALEEEHEEICHDI